MSRGDFRHIIGGGAILAALLCGCAAGVADDGFSFTTGPLPGTTAGGASTTGAGTTGEGDGSGSSGGVSGASTSGDTTGAGGSTGWGTTDAGTTGAGTTGAGTTGGGTTGDATTGGAVTGSGSTGGASTGGAGSCGDGIVDAGEACDDGNLVEADGCTTACLVGPVDIDLTSSSDTLLRGNAGGGTLFADACPAGQVLVGLEGTAMPYIRGIKGTCASPSLTSNLEITTSPGAALPARGMWEGTPWSRQCPANQAIVGFSGMAGQLIDQLVVRCAPLEVTEAGGIYSVELGPVGSLSAAGQVGGSAFAATDCGASRVATGLNVRTGDALDALGMACHQIGPVFQ